jgi:homopolymeric O-antigen transport system ATP-binding protein
MRPIISVEKLGKQYTIGVRQESFVTLRDALMDTLRAPLRRIKRSIGRDEAVRIWAVSDVSFDIAKGEIVGIIGRNGAGKSTLLKLLSRITEPTRGRIDLYGRIASLLEVGTGFHPELSGRDNIYLNGAILGMRRAEIARNFDEIVAFAEVEKFIDTPVKRYSSGMYLRLAFAVAAHLEPEILLVDEVLAVGDARFQRKCLSKMQDAGRQGRTVLFVSHSMPAITRLCPRTIMLDEGRVLCDGPSHEVVSTYLGSGLGTTAAREWPDPGKAPGNDIVRLCAVRVRTEDGRVCDAIDIRCPVGVEMEFEVLEEGQVLVPNFNFINQEGICVFVVSEHNAEWRRRPRPAGRYLSTAWLPGNFLSEGTLIVGAAVSTVSTMDSVTVHFFEQDVVAFQVIDSLDGNSARGDFAGPMPGIVRPLLHWTSQFTPAATEASHRG